MRLLVDAAVERYLQRRRITRTRPDLARCRATGQQPVRTLGRTHGAGIGCHRREPGRIGASPPATPGFRLGLTPCAAPPAAVVSDEQILALVAAADGLRRRQRQRYAGGSPAPAADERLLRLDWAVQAGRLVLADRAAQALTSTSGAAQPWRGQL